MPLDSSYNIGQSVGAKLRAARQAKKYTQGQLAQPEFSVSYISAIERGQIQPSLRALELLAKRLGLSTGDLLPARGDRGEQIANCEGLSLKEAEYDMLLLEAQIALHQGQHEEAIRLLRTQLGQQKEPRLDISISYILGLAYLESGHLQESEEILAKIVGKAQESADPLYPAILSLQSAIYGAMRNPTRAIRLEYESLAAIEQDPLSQLDVFFLARIYSNIGRYALSQGQLEKARGMFQQALTLLGDTTSSYQLKSIYGNLAQFYHEKGESQYASLYDYKWYLTDLRSQFAALKCDIQHGLGQSLLKGNPEEAYASLVAQLEESDAQTTPLIRASTNINLAAWFLSRREYSDAESYARESLTLAAPFGDTIIMAEAQLLLGEIAYTRQDYSYGDQCFLAGLAVLESLETYEDLIEHLANYAQLLEKRGIIQKALGYWKQAYEYRNKIS
jgi:tetratricopeptide (TPR) repeat protein